MKKVTTIHEIEHIDNLSESIFVYPTETIYGIGCTYNNRDGFEKIMKIKHRHPEKVPLIIVDSLKMVKEYSLLLDPLEEALFRLKLPLTLLVTPRDNIPSYLVSDCKEVGIRITSSLWSKKIIEVVGVPILSTSANISGSLFIYPHPNCDASLMQEVDYIFDAGVDFTPTKPSTVVRVVQGTIECIREGSISSKTLSLLA